jgi:pimeloyl-ACP methyl ester carboxylesterase
MHLRSRLIAAASLALTLIGAWLPASAGEIKNVVIVHGAFAGGEGWQKVFELLTTKGYKVTLVQEPLTSLQDDVAATRRILALQDGPTVLVGHSYGGMVITEAGNDEKVSALVYIAAFQPEKGESLEKLAQSESDPNVHRGWIKETADGYRYLDPVKFADAFAADLPKGQANFLARSQTFAARTVFTTEAGEPAWKSKPSWYLLATHDRSIGPALQSDMAKRGGSKVTKVDASHGVYLSKPAAVAALIVEAAEAVSK